MIRATLALAVGFAIPWGAWTARNLASIGHASDNRIMIGTIHHGSYPGFMYRDDPATLGFPYKYDPGRAEAVQSMGSVLAHVRDEFAERPLRMLRWYVLEKPFYFVAWDPIQGAGDVFNYPVLSSPYLTRTEFIGSRDLMHALHWPLMVASYLGAVLAWTPWAKRVLPRDALRAARVLGMLLGYAVLLHMVAAPFPRYSVPFRPIQYTLALLGPVIAWRVLQRSQAAPGAA